VPAAYGQPTQKKLWLPDGFCFDQIPHRVPVMDLDGDVNPSAWVSPQLKRNRGLFLSPWLRQRSDQGAAFTPRRIL
jgi:hypothetical protein